MSVLDQPVDSKVGIEHLMRWAKTGGFVLYPYHRSIARKFGVSTDGVMFADPIPTK